MQNAKSFFPSLLSFLFSLLFSAPVFSQIQINLCSNGYSNVANGEFFDSGGPFNSYQNYEDCTLLIDPGCAEVITITVQEYHTEQCCDWLRFFDGPDDSSPLILNMQYLNAPQTASFSSGKVYVRWHSDLSVTGNGFRVSWTSELIASDPPMANFTVSDATPALQENVQFEASATNIPFQWQWDFGDPGSGENSSMLQNPSHAFSAPGLYTVRLTVTNCYGQSDMTEQVLEVQPAPVVSFNPGQLDVTLDCGATAQTSLNLNNTGPGDLIFSFAGGNASISPSEGKIEPGNSLQLSVQFSGANLFAGDYSGTVNLATNDPSQPLLEIPYSLHVLGIAALMPSPNMLDFGSLQQFSQTTGQVAISNPGCNTLIVQSIATTSASYTVAPQQLTVPPFSTETVTVTFAPQDTGWQLANLVLQSNIGTDNLPLAGYSVAAPIMSVNPASLTATLACGDSVSLPLTITNTGLGDLEIQVSGVGGNSGQGPLKVLTIFAGAYNSFVAERTEEAVLARFPDAVFTRFFDWQNANELPGILANQNLVVVPFLGSYPNSFYEQIGQALSPFVLSGGGLIFAGTNNPDGLNAYGFLQCSNDLVDAFTLPLEAIVPQHPILQGVNLQTPAPDNCFIANFIGPGFQPLAKVPGYPHTAVGVLPFGSGKVAYIGHVYGNHNDDVIKLLENTVNWCASTTWLSASPTSITVPAGGSAIIQVNFSAAGLIEDTYSSNLVLLTNDPQNHELTVPCTMIVDGEPQMEGLETNLDFGILQQFAHKDLSVDFENTGCANLNILSATTDNPFFQILNFDAATLPAASGSLKLRYAPVTIASHLATLTLVTDNGTFTVALSGIAVGAPVGAVAPSSLSVDLACDESVTISLALSNSGLGSMNYQVGNLQSPRNVLAMTYGAYSVGWFNFRTLMLQEVPNVRLSEYGGNDAAQLADSIALNKVDVLIVSSLNDSNSSTYLSFAPVIESFVQNGGQVIALGAYYPESLEQLGLFELIGTEYYNNSQLRVKDKNHRLAAGIPDVFPTVGSFYSGTFPFAEVHEVIVGPSDYQTYLGYRTLGQGNVVYWAPIFDYVDVSDAPIMKNIFAWLSNPLPSGVDMPAVAGIVPIGGSVNIPVVFSGQGLPGGQYQGQIQIYSNDPVNNPIIVPVTLNVSFKPCAAFEFTMPPCSGTVNFTENSLNTPNSWNWAFGDGGTSPAQNPSHTYAGEGVYTVTLVSCNNFGCDTLTQEVELASIDGPKLANCNPQTISSCCDEGIFRVQIGLLDHSSGNAATEGYQDFSCAKGTELMAGIQFPLTVTTGSQYEENVRGWIDLNNNGVFSDNEQIINDQAFLTHHAFFTPPINAVKDVPLRMRIMSESTNFPITTPCINLSYGQCEDYYVVIKTTVGTPEPGEQVNARVYPNPSAGETWLEFSLQEAKPIHLKIVDQIGRVVWEHNVENATVGVNRLALPELPAGAFAVAVQTGEDIIVEKFVRVERP